MKAGIFFNVKEKIFEIQVGTMILSVFKLHLWHIVLYLGGHRHFAIL